MDIKTALVDGQITPELFARLESMGFEIVDMNDREAMRDLRHRVRIEESMQIVDDMGIDSLKGKRIGIVGSLGHIGIGRECLSASMLPALPYVVDAVNRLADDEERSHKERQRVMVIEQYTPEPMPKVRIDKKKDNSKFFDFKYGRGRARNQQFGKYFKHP